jgi:hypothetical protein
MVSFLFYILNFIRVGGGGHILFIGPVVTKNKKKGGIKENKNDFFKGI